MLIISSRARAGCNVGTAAEGKRNQEEERRGQ